jgi:hypothetical protein
LAFIPAQFARPDNRAHTGSGHELHGNRGFFKRFENTYMRQAARKAASQGQPQLEAPWRYKLLGWLKGRTG